MKKRFPFLLLTFIIVKSSLAQDTLPLKLQDVLNVALKNNKEILLAALDQESATAKFRQTNAVFLPQLNLNYTAMVTNNPLNAFGFKLQQQSVSPADFNPLVLNNPSATQNYMAMAQWKQPLLNMDLFYQRRAARQQLDVYQYKMVRTKEYLTYEIQKAYAQLQLAHQAVRVLEEALLHVDSIFEVTKNYFDKGYLQKSELLLVQVRVASIENKLSEARSNVCNASDYISLLMGKKSGVIYSVDPLQKTEQVTKTAQLVPGNRADLQALKSMVKAQEMAVNAEKMSYLPKLNAFADYMLNDKAALGFGSNSYLFGAQCSWNIFNGTASHYRIAEQKAMRSKMEEQLNYQKDQSQLELDKMLRQLHDAQFDVQQHETSVGQATEAFRIQQDRFKQGLLPTTDLLLTQSALSEQKLLLTEALFRYNTTLAYVQFLTSTSENK